MHALVIGAGIAGPVTALALERAGWSATVVDAWPDPDADVGSYLTLAPNGIDALRAVNADQAVSAIGFETHATRLISHTGRVLADVPLRGLRSEAPAGRTLRRAQLARVLRTVALERGIQVVHGRRLIALAESADGVEATFADGGALRSDLVVGADGVHSVVRRHLDPGAPNGRYVGLVNFGGYTPDCGLAASTGVWQMIFGKSAFFGYIVDPVGGAVWFANVPRAPTDPEERARTDEAAWKATLVRLFEGDAGPAVALIRAGRLELAGDNTCDLPSVPVWRRGRCVILGDAAHAPSPSSGQGAAMAIEDGVVLGICLRDAPDVPTALAAFEARRRVRVERIVAQGAQSSSSKAAGPLGRWLRDLMMPAVFRYVVTPASQAWMYDHHIDWIESPG